MNTDKLKAWIEENADDYCSVGSCGEAGDSEPCVPVNDLLAFLSEQDDWIDVNERLPENSQNVRFKLECGDDLGGFFFDGDFSRSVDAYWYSTKDMQMRTHVTHWKPAQRGDV